MRIHEFQLADMTTREAIITSGGVLVVTEAGSAKRLTLYDPDNGFVALTQPVSATRGKFRFATDDAVQEVDVYGQAPGGHCFSVLGVTPQEHAEFFIDTLRAHQLMVIPFDFSLGSAEVATGFVEPAGSIFLPDGTGIKVTAVDAAATINVGTETADGGDPDGYIAAASLAAEGVVLDRGAFLDAAGAYISHVAAGDGIAITLSAGVDTAEGFAYLPFLLPQVGA